MQAHSRSPAWLKLAATIFVVVCCGCASIPGASDTEEESFTEAAQYQRKPEKSILPFSVSDRGREIEKDLGVRR